MQAKGRARQILTSPKVLFFRQIITFTLEIYSVNRILRRRKKQIITASVLFEFDRKTLVFSGFAKGIC